MEKFMALDNNLKKELVKKFGKTGNDCGSTEVQIALLTENINNYQNVSGLNYAVEDVEFYEQTEEMR